MSTYLIVVKIISPQLGSVIISYSLFIKQ